MVVVDYSSDRRAIVFEHLYFRWSRDDNTNSLIILLSAVCKATGNDAASTKESTIHIFLLLVGGVLKQPLWDKFKNYNTRKIYPIILFCIFFNLQNLD